VELTEADAGGEHALGVGQEAVLRLPENRTTGYRWQVSAPDGVQVEDGGFEPAPSGAPGAGGTRTFRLRATVAGTHPVTAGLRRSWESGGAAPGDLAYRLRTTD
jgi:inhibitor of cysteine peptidase